MGQTNVNAGGGDSGMGAGMIVGLVLAIVIIGFIVWYFALGGNGGTTDGNTPLQSILPSLGLPASS